ncbi:MAG: hypothetical protein QNJ54_11785 [Prochloraceae cyanobacterium]|nr:hypothetical protein [Prochloraceae cyanobacterium]
MFDELFFQDLSDELASKLVGGDEIVPDDGDDGDDKKDDGDSDLPDSGPDGG